VGCIDCVSYFVMVSVYALLPSTLRINERVKEWGREATLCRLHAPIARKGRDVRACLAISYATSLVRSFFVYPQVFLDFGPQLNAA
jgi:hypothetical protein